MIIDYVEAWKSSLRVVIENNGWVCNDGMTDQVVFVFAEAPAPAEAEATPDDGGAKKKKKKKKAAK